MGKVKVALAGVGNCPSALIQGIEYYRKNPPVENVLTTGLMHPKFGNYAVEDITFIAAFEVNRTAGQILSLSSRVSHSGRKLWRDRCL